MQSINQNLPLSGLIQLAIYILFFPENRIWHYMEIVSIGNNLHEVSKSVSWGKYEKYSKMSHVENFTQTAKH